jgi:hypothetical protein
MVSNISLCFSLLCSPFNNVTDFVRLRVVSNKLIEYFEQHLFCHCILLGDLE